MTVMQKKTALIYSPEFSRFSFGEDHPFKLRRFRLAFELMTEYGLTVLPHAKVFECEPASEKDILTFHSQNYLAKLKEFSSADEPRADFRYGLGDAENPVFKGFYEWAALGAGGTLRAARLVADEGYETAFNLAGGWHHAHRSRASGFSYINDCVVAINILLEKGMRVVYLDIDAHHSDGVQEAFYDTDRVLNISIHESGMHFFPGSGFEKETGSGRGKGYTINVPLLEHTDDALYMKAFDEVAFPLIAAYDPDIMVTQLGADTFRTDPLTRLEVTTHSYSYIIKKLKALRIPWVALGGGGYESLNVARAWTLAWSIMNDVDLPARLPAAFVRTIKELGFSNSMLPDAMHWAEVGDRNRSLVAVEKSIATIRKKIFPVIIGAYGKDPG
jgi:acetoin utilization protein AcuC